MALDLGWMRRPESLLLFFKRRPTDDLRKSWDMMAHSSKSAPRTMSVVVHDPNDGIPATAVVMVGWRAAMRGLWRQVDGKLSQRPFNVGGWQVGKTVGVEQRWNSERVRR